MPKYVIKSWKIISKGFGWLIFFIFKHFSFSGHLSKIGNICQFTAWYHLVTQNKGVRSKVCIDLWRWGKSDIVSLIDISEPNSFRRCLSQSVLFIILGFTTAKSRQVESDKYITTWTSLKEHSCQIEKAAKRVKMVSFTLPLPPYWKSEK